MLRLRESALKWREVDGEAMLLDLRTSTYLAVNGSATLLWRRLAEGTTRDDLVEALRAAYGIAPDQAGRDVDVFLQDCAARGFVEEVAPEGGPGPDSA